MNLEDFHLPKWKRLRWREQLVVASELNKHHLPEGFSFDQVEFFSLGSEVHPVALFDWRPDMPRSTTWCQGKFALIPGGTITLGYDRDNPWHPTAAQQKSWDITQEEYDFPDLHDYLDEAMTPLREVQLHPFLMEVTPIQSTVFPVDPVLFPHLSSCAWLPGSQYREMIQFVTEDGIKLQVPIKYSDEVVRDSREFGFRSPTSNEWEWACAAGSRTMWRWGDDCPTNGYPHRYSDYASWNLHIRPNAFGLVIGHDDYEADYCENGIIRGGDGGSTTCGGGGFLAAWLLLASSHFEKAHPHSTSTPRGTRRVFPLDQVLS